MSYNQKAIFLLCVTVSEIVTESGGAGEAMDKHPTGWILLLTLLKASSQKYWPFCNSQNVCQPKRGVHYQHVICWCCSACFTGDCLPRSALRRMKCRKFPTWLILNHPLKCSALYPSRKMSPWDRILLERSKHCTNAAMRERLWIKPVTLKVLCKDFYEQRAWDVTTHNQERLHES